MAAQIATLKHILVKNTFNMNKVNIVTTMLKIAVKFFHSFKNKFIDCFLTPYLQGKMIGASELPLKMWNNGMAMKPIAATTSWMVKQREPSSIVQIQKRTFATTQSVKDIDSACKFIGAGAATIGVAGSGTLIILI